MQIRPERDNDIERWPQLSAARLAGPWHAVHASMYADLATAPAARVSAHWISPAQMFMRSGPDIDDNGSLANWEFSAALTRGGYVPEPGLTDQLFALYDTGPRDGVIDRAELQAMIDDGVLVLDGASGNAQIDPFILAMVKERAQPASTPFTVTTYNVRYDNADSSMDYVDELSETGADGQPPSDIIMLQEVELGPLKRFAHRLHDTHTPYVGNGRDGGTDGEFNPIFYNTERFDAIHTEQLKLHEDGEFGAGSARIANFVLLRDKATGATVLVVNTHLDNQSPEARSIGMAKIQAKIDEIRNMHPGWVDGVLLGGDFNAGADLAGDGFSAPDEDAAFENPDGKYTTVDHLLLSNEDFQAPGAQELPTYHVADTGHSDHLSRTITVTVDTTPTALQDRSGFRNANLGAIAYEHVGQTGSDAPLVGNAWIFGFGLDPTETNWNDELSGIWLPPGVAVEAYRHNEAPGDDNPPDLYTSTTDYFADANDQYSRFSWHLI